MVCGQLHYSTFCFAILKIDRELIKSCNMVTNLHASTSLKIISIVYVCYMKPRVICWVCIHYFMIKHLRGVKLFLLSFAEPSCGGTMLLQLRLGITEKDPVLFESMSL